MFMSTVAEKKHIVNKTLFLQSSCVCAASQSTATTCPYPYNGTAELNDCPIISELLQPQHTTSDGQNRPHTNHLPQLWQCNFSPAGNMLETKPPFSFKPQPLKVTLKALVERLLFNLCFALFLKGELKSKRLQ